MTKYSNDLKLKIVNQHFNHCYSAKELANHYQISVHTITTWLTKVKNCGTKSILTKHTKRHFSPQFKLNLVQTYLSTNQSLKDIAYSHNLNTDQLLNWIRLYQKQGDVGLTPKPKGRKPMTKQKLETIEDYKNYTLELEKENKRLKSSLTSQQLQILKKLGIVN